MSWVFRLFCVWWSYFQGKYNDHAARILWLFELIITGFVKICLWCVCVCVDSLIGLRKREANFFFQVICEPNTQQDVPPLLIPGNIIQGADYGRCAV